MAWEGPQPEWRDRPRRPSIGDVLLPELGGSGEVGGESDTLGLRTGTGDQPPGVGEARDQPARRGEWR